MFMTTADIIDLTKSDDDDDDAKKRFDSRISLKASDDNLSDSDDSLTDEQTSSR